MSSMTPRMKTPFAYTLKNSLFGANTSRNVINGYCCSTNRENYCAEDAGQTLRHGRKTKEKIIANNEPLRKKNGDELKGGTLTRKIKQYKCDDKSQMVKNASAKLINEMIIDNKAKTIKTKKQRSNRKYRESEMKIDKIVLPKEEYLLIDDQFLVISNRMSTSQKLLSTFKSMCLDGAATKQIYQDNNRQQKLKLDKNKVNIF